MTLVARTRACFGYPVRDDTIECMRIGVLTHNYPRFAGDFSGVFVEALCREYVALGHEVCVWTPDDAAFTRPDTAGEWGGVQVRPYRYALPRSAQKLGYMRSMQGDLRLKVSNYLLSPALFAAGIAKVLRDADAWRPDVLHAHWLLPNGYIAAVAAERLGIPIVVSVPGSDAQVAAANPLFRAMARKVFATAALLTANSAELRDAVVTLGADPARFDMIIYGVNPDALKPSCDGVAPLRQRWATELGIDADETTFALCVGRMVPKKGFDVLIRALAEAPLRERKVAAIMVGNGDSKHEWQLLAQELGVDKRILWAGTVPYAELGQWYNAADLLAMPSVSLPADGLNVCVLDAMACGKPVVASEVAGNPLAVVQGETGLLLPEQDAAGLAQAVAMLADTPVLRHYLGTNGRRRIEEELGWRPLARRYIAHFEQLAGQRDSR